MYINENNKNPSAQLEMSNPINEPDNILFNINFIS